jgi:hypothetical protein
LGLFSNFPFLQNPPVTITAQKNPWLPLGAGLGAGALFFVAALRSPWIGLAAVIGLAVCVVAFLRPGIGMGFLTFLIPLERLQRFTGDNTTFTISVMRLLAVACLGAIIVHRLKQRRPLKLHPAMFLYGLFALLAMAGLFYSTDPEGTARGVGTIAANCLFFFLYYNYFENRSQIRVAIMIWLAANLVGAAYSTYDWHFGSGKKGGVETSADPGEGIQAAENRWATVWQDRAEWETLGGLSVRRSMGPTSHAAVYGINLIMTIPFFFLLLNQYQKPWQQIGLYLCLALTGYNVLLTNTRAVILQAAGTVVLCFLFGLVRVRAWHLISIAVAAAVAIPLLPRDLFNRVLDPHNYSSEKSAAMRIRFEYWKVGLGLVAENPFLGIGISNAKEVPRYTHDLAPGQTTVHNIFVEVALETGITGWILFFSFVTWAFIATRRAAQRLRDFPEHEEERQWMIAIQVAMISVLIFGLQVDVFDFPLKGWWLLVTISFIVYGWTKKLPRKNEGVVPVLEAVPA